MSTTTSKRSARLNAGVKGSNTQTSSSENAGESGAKSMRTSIAQDVPTAGIDDKAEQMTYSAELNAANVMKTEATLLEDAKLCDAIRSIVVGDLKDVGKNAASSNLRVTLVGLRNINRLLQLRLKTSRDTVAAARQSAENKHLVLENLLYEVGHLEKQIATCRSFRSRADDIPLIPVEEFYASAPAAISRPEETHKDDHELFKARLAWELEQRKNVAELLKTVQAEVDLVTARIETKKSLLEAIRPRLKSVIEASSGLDDVLKSNNEKSGAMAPLSCPSTRKQVEMAMLLPQSLHAIYVKQRALLEVRGSEIDLHSVEIVPTRGGNAPSAVAASSDLASQPHELSVATTVITCGARFRLVISCFPDLGGLLVAEAKLALVDSSNSAAMIPAKIAQLLDNPYLLLVNLVSTTNRRKMAASIPPSIRRRLPAVLSTSATLALNLAFHWLHTFAGALPFTADGCDQVEFLKSAMSADRLVAALTDRTSSRVTLCRVLSELDSGQLPIECATTASSEFPLNLSANIRVVDFSFMGLLDGTKTALDLAAASSVEVIPSEDCKVFRSLDERGFYYRIKLEKTKLVLIADVIVPADYPQQWPMFFLSSNATVNKVELRVLLDQIENDVNADVGRRLLALMSVPGEGDRNKEVMLRLLAVQICQLATCWDAVVAGGNFTPIQRHQKQQRRGRDRLTAWRYDSAKGYVFIEDEPISSLGAVSDTKAQWNSADSDDESSTESADEATVVAEKREERLGERRSLQQADAEQQRQMMEQLPEEWSGS